MSGWIKLHRSITDNPLWDSEPFTKSQAWVDLLLHANFTDNKIIIKGQVLELKRGQQARSEYTLAKQWKWSKNKVRRFLELLRKQQMIETKSTPLTSIITICNYNNYQDLDTTDGTTRGTGIGTTSELPTAHSKEGKERKEGKEQTPRKFSDDDLRCAEWIFRLIQQLNNKAKEPNFEKWADTIRLMRERDSKTHHEICELFKWANNDSFWQSNILSPETLRKQWDKLTLQRQRPSTQTNKTMTIEQLARDVDF